MALRTAYDPWGITTKRGSAWNRPRLCSTLIAPPTHLCTSARPKRASKPWDRPGLIYMIIKGSWHAAPPCKTAISWRLGRPDGELHAAVTWRTWTIAEAVLTRAKHLRAPQLVCETISNAKPIHKAIYHSVRFRRSRLIRSGRRSTRVRAREISPDLKPGG